MQAVYNTNFKKPWDTPYPATNKNYGEYSKYEFQKLDGIEHDPKLTYYMRYFRQPSSPEFEAIHWREGRIELSLGGAASDGPVLWADFDIDNDGKVESVLVPSFFHKWQSGGAAYMVAGYFHESPISTDGTYIDSDYLTIVSGGSIEHMPYISDSWLIETIHKAVSGDSPTRLLNDRLGLGFRPFIYKSVTYISAYNQQSIGHPSSKKVSRTETIEILKYLRGGGWDMRTKKWGSLNTERICAFQMIPYGK
jgi:hypothetical protein